VSTSATKGNPAQRRPVRHRGRTRRLARIALLTATTATVAQAFLTFVIAPLTNSSALEFEDFTYYYGAGQAVSRGISPYASFNAGPDNMTFSGFDYPPLVAWLLQPLGHLPKHIAATAFLWVALVCTVAGALIITHCVLPARWPRTQLALIASFVYSPATYNFWHGQMNPLVFLILAIALWAYVNDREVLCGIALGLGAGIKVAPVVLVLLLVRRRWWRGTLTMGVVGFAWLVLGVVALGFAVLHEYLTKVIPALSRENGWLYNQSWSGLINRAANHSILSFDPASSPIQVVTLILAAGSLALVAWAVHAAPRTRAERSGEFGTAVAAMILCATVAWYPHETHLLIPFAAAAALATQRTGNLRAALLVALGVAVVTIAVVAPVLIAASPFATIVSIHAGRWWYVYLQLWSLPALGTAGLMVALAIATHRTDTPTRHGSMTTATPE
jgi:hypothetical protein